mmetsp:Transcript_27219/g.49233  ORF Transcript_27219/g.49233 Transcript_27219/m.49233 type:complete len:451 (+) Transcript_27219:71-1423(+)
MASTEEMVTQLKEIAGVGDQDARQLLEATNWQLEDAIQLHFAGEEALPQQASSPSSSSRAATPALLREPEMPADVGVEAPAEVAQNGWFGALGRAIAGFGQAIMGVASEDFETWFSDRFGDPVPKFSKASFGDTVQETLAKNRLLLAWFHQDDSHAEALCREIFQSDVVLDALEEGYDLWAGDVCRFEPLQISKLLGVVKFPALVILLPRRSGYDTNHFCLEWPLGTFSQPLHRFVPEHVGDPLDTGMVIAAIATAAQDYHEEVQLNQERTRRRSTQIDQDRLLREQQDREYEEALLADQLAAVQRSKEEVGAAETAAPEAEAVAAAEAEKEAKAAAAAAAEKAAEEEAKRQKRGAEILAEPEPVRGNGSATARLSLRLPSGDRLQRTFRAEQVLEEVYEWAHCCRPKAKPLNFELCISFPARSLQDKTKTLKELDLVPSAALVLKEADS